MNRYILRAIVGLMVAVGITCMSIGTVRAYVVPCLVSNIKTGLYDPATAAGPLNSIVAIGTYTVGLSFDFGPGGCERESVKVAAVVNGKSVDLPITRVSQANASERWSGTVTAANLGALAGSPLKIVASIKLVSQSEPFEQSMDVTVQPGSATTNNQNTTAETGSTSTAVDERIVNPISYNSLGELIVALIRFLLIMVGSLAVLFIIIGAVRMVTSAGNEKAVTAGKQTVQWAVLGLVAALMSFSLIALVQSLIGRQ